MTDNIAQAASNRARIGRGQATGQDEPPPAPLSLQGHVPTPGQGDAPRSPEGTSGRVAIDPEQAAPVDPRNDPQNPQKPRKTGEQDNAHLTLAQYVINAPAQHRPRPERRVERWEARNWLRSHSRLDRVRECGTFAVGRGWVDDPDEGRPEVKIVVGGATGVAGVRGLNCCCSTWACPRCGGRIASGRATEVRKAIAAAEAEGLGVLMLTLTGGHDLDWPLGRSWDAVAEAWRRLTAGRPWARWKAEVGLEGSIRACETTLSVRAGWHVHLHVLIFVQDPMAAMASKQAIFDLWRGRAEARGLAVDDRGQGLELPRADSDWLAGYIAKQGQGWDLAAEVALGAVKQGHGTSKTPFQILAEVARREDFRSDEYSELRNAWAEWERDSKGRRAMTWSRGLKDRFGVGEQTDEELAAMKDDGEEVYTLADWEWQELRQTPGLLVDLLRGVEAGDPWGVLGD